MGDITKGYTFTDGLENDCSAAHLHSLIESGVINTTFHTGKPSGGANPDLTVLEMMCYRSSDGAFVKLGVSSLAAGNNTFIHGLTAKTAPVGADETVIADSAAGYVQKKLTLANLLYGTTAWATPIAGDKIPIYDSAGTALKNITLANLISGGTQLASVDGEEKLLVLTNAGALRWSELRNLVAAATAQAAVSGLEQFSVYTPGVATYKRLALWQLLYLQNALSAPADADLFLVANVAGTATKKLTAANLKSYARAGFIQFSDRKAVSTVGGTLTAGSWAGYRALNTAAFDDGTSGCSLALADGFSVRCPAGTYRFRARSPFYRTDACRIRLYNWTAGAPLTDPTGLTFDGESNNGYSGSTGTNQIPCEASGYFTVGVTTDIRIQYQIQTSSSTSDGGHASNFGSIEVYSILDLWRLA